MQVLNRQVSAQAEALPVSSIQVPRRLVTTAWGGTETTVVETSRALAGAGHPTRIFTSLALSDRAEEDVSGVPVRRFPYVYPFFGLSRDARQEMDRKGGNLVSLALLRALLREPDIRLLHAHSGKRLGGIVRTAARHRGIPYVVTLHGNVFDVPRAQMDDLTAPIRGKFEWGRPLGMMLGSRRVLADADAVICVGQKEFEAAREALPGHRVEFLPNGVDSTRFARGNGRRLRARLAIPDTAKVMLCVSRIDPQKDQLSLIESLPSVIPGLAPGDPRLVEAYHSADVFCLPSMHEPFGIVILEAWAAGLPVIASRVGGIPGFVRDGSDALLFQPGDVTGLASAATTILRNFGLACRLADEGRARACSEFDWTVIGRRVADLYQDVVRRHG
jgi:glycosyltransferase involved in cell wall biosynthesis